MSHPIALRAIIPVVEQGLRELAVAAQDDSLSWEEVSAIAGQQNARLLQLSNALDKGADRLVDAAADDARQVGMFMFNQAVREADPDFVTDLAEGVNVLADRRRKSASEGRPLRTSLMDPQVRKALFLIESYTRAGRNPDITSEPKS